MTNKPATFFYRENAKHYSTDKCLISIRCVIDGKPVANPIYDGCDFSRSHWELDALDDIIVSAKQDAKSITLEMHFSDDSIIFKNVYQEINPPTVNMFTAPLASLQLYGHLAYNLKTEKLENDQFHFMAALDDMESNSKWMRYNSRRYKKCLEVLDKVTHILKVRAATPFQD